MTSTQRSLLAGGVLVAAIAAGVYLSASPPSAVPVAAKAPTTSSATAPATSAASNASAGSASAGAPTPAGSTPVAAASPASDAPPARVYTEAELALPPEQPDPPGTDACEAYARNKRDLHTAQALLMRLPPQNIETLGGQRLRAMRDRLEARLAQRTSDLEASGRTCPTP